MIQTLNIPYSSKTDEIMSRYRPIAPKPEIPTTNSATTSSVTNPVTNTPSFDASLVPEKFRQSPYLRNIWSHLQARPTRTRKRGRTSSISSTTLKQQQQQQQGNNLGRATNFIGLTTTSRNLSIQGFGIYNDHQQHAILQNECKIENNNNNVVELPLFENLNSKSIDLNVDVVDTTKEKQPIITPLLEEKDLLLQLQVPSPETTPTTRRVISPLPVRPVGSSISIIGNISLDLVAKAVVKPPQEVEAVTEAEVFPAIISDRSNKVRMVNSAYKELVGQPECPWLNSMCSGSGGGRISGEVMLLVSENGLPVSSNGFSCWVKIEWESEGKKKNSINAFCEVVKVVCLGKDYVFSWRFHTREVSPSGSKV